MKKIFSIAVLSSLIMAAVAQSGPVINFTFNPDKKTYNQNDPMLVTFSVSGIPAGAKPYLYSYWTYELDGKRSGRINGAGVYLKAGVGYVSTRVPANTKAKLHKFHVEVVQLGAYREARVSVK